MTQGDDGCVRSSSAYILTRPLGASLGDLLSQERENGGAGLRTVVTSLVFLGVIAALVIAISLRPEYDAAHDVARSPAAKA